MIVIADVADLSILNLVDISVRCTKGQRKEIRNLIAYKLKHREMSYEEFNKLLGYSDQLMKLTTLANEHDN